MAKISGGSSGFAERNAIHPRLSGFTGPTRIVTPYAGLPGKGSAFRTIFRIAAELDVTACCVVDSDLRSITPEWVELLLEPITRHGRAVHAAD